MKLFLTSISLALIALGGTQQAHASGQVTLQGNDYLGQGQIHPLAGLSIYERLGRSRFAINGWGGFGTRPDQTSGDTRSWSSLKLSLDYNLGRSVVAAGYQRNMGASDMFGANGNEDIVFVKAAYKLWN